MRSQPQASVVGPIELLIGILVFAFVASLAFAAAPALGAYGVAGSFGGGGSGPGGSGSEDGQLSNPGQADVRSATGKLYVADTGNNRVEVFSAETGGAYDSQVAITAPKGLAIDQSTGDVYVANASGISKFDSSLNQIAGPAWTDPAVTGTLAVDPSTHDLLVADQGANLIRRFSSTGTPGATFAAERPLDLAVDSTGDVIVITSTGDITQQCGASSTVRRLSAAGVSEGTIGSLAAPAAVVIDPDDDSVVVTFAINGFFCTSDVASIAQFDVGGVPGPVVNMPPDTRYALVPGLAAAGAGSSRIYAVSRNFGGLGNTQVTVIANGPDLTLDPAGAIAGTAAALSGTVDPNGVQTNWHFEYRLTGTDAWTSTPDQDAGSGTAPVPVGFEATGLEASSGYDFRLVATSPNGLAESPVGQFTTAGIAPNGTTLRATQRTTTSGRLNARVTPNNQATSYYFEYGTDTSYGSIAPIVPLSVGATVPQKVSRVIEGLQPGTTYHYRVVAENASGAAQGSDLSFTTLAAAPEGRVYEQVSPVEKSGVDVRSDPQPNYAAFLSSSSGDSISYIAKGSFGDAPTSLYYTGYLARRSDDGWNSSPTDIPQINVDQFGRVGSVIATSDDLSHAVVTSRVALVPDAVDGNFNVYLRDNRTGNLELIFTTSAMPTSWEKLSTVQDSGPIVGTPNFDHVLIPEPLALTSDAPDNGLLKLYEYSDGELRLASIMPGGSPVTTATAMSAPADFRNKISDDGSRYFFEVGPQQSYGFEGLFMREGDETIPISVSQRTGDGPAVKDGTFRDASADGNVVYFTSRSQLTDDASANISYPSEGDLYRYQVDTGTLIDVSATSDPVNASGPDMTQNPVLGASEDGQRVYFQARGKLTPDATYGNRNTYLWHAGQLQLVTSGPSVAEDVADAQLSPDGRLIVFTSRAEATGYDNHNPKCGMAQNGFRCQVLYVFDPAVDGVQCASCDTNDRRPAANAYLGVTDGFNNPRFNAITNDGRVFFSSPDKLVPGDTNGKTDVYQWQDGAQSLISTGKGTSDSRFFTASPDGRNVFFATDQQLVAQDTDNLVDLYDARQGGGLVSQNPPTAAAPCSGEDCKAPPSGRPDGAQPGSVSVVGAGRSPSRCRHMDARKRKHAAKHKKKATKKSKHARASATKRCNKRSGK